MESALTVVLLLVVATGAVAFFVVPRKRKHRDITPVSNRSRKKRARKKHHA
ncbi:MULTISPECIES: hypothetical protein [Ferrimonas]|uniref:hypothetical protein n=1 Tax=Ferrimonas TaxID=44011 RepID=UPI00040BDDCC|nr:MULTISPECIES: hypothetical protein [Ferrimonas]USD37164.1 hypothetical protein J8Z22_19615 [Ferrimonas sp. SCSIO 43195]